MENDTQGKTLKVTKKELKVKSSADQWTLVT